MGYFTMIFHQGNNNPHYFCLWLNLFIFSCCDVIVSGNMVTKALLVCDLVRYGDVNFLVNNVGT